MGREIDSILVNGRIPEYTECPWTWCCLSHEIGNCIHEGYHHPNPYSCGLASGLEMTGKPTNEEREEGDSSY